MAAYDASYFQAIFLSIPRFHQNRLTTTANVNAGGVNYQIHKFYDLRILQHFTRGLSNFDLTKPAEFDRLVDYLYEINLHPNLETAELRVIRDSKNRKEYLSKEATEERVQIATFPPKGQASALDNWTKKQVEQPKEIRPIVHEKPIPLKELTPQNPPILPTPIVKPPRGEEIFSIPMPKESAASAQQTARENIALSDRAKFKARNQVSQPITEGSLALKPRLVPPQTLKEPRSLEDFRSSKKPSTPNINLDQQSRIKHIGTKLSNISHPLKIAIYKAYKPRETPENAVIGLFAIGGAVFGATSGGSPLVGAVLGGATGLGVTQYFKRGGNIPIPQSLGRSGNFPFFRRGTSSGGTGFVKSTGKKSILIWLLLIGVTGLLIAMFLFGLFGQNNNEYRLQLSKTGPVGEKVENKQDISFQISATFSGPGPADLEITDIIPPNTQFVIASDSIIPQGETLKWTFTKLNPGETKSVSFTVRPREDNIWVANAAKARIIKKYESDLGNITKGGSSQVSKDQDISYEINITYTGSGLGDVEVTDPIPQNTQYVEGSANEGGILEGNIVKWNLKQIPANSPRKLTFKVKPLIDNIEVQNTAEAKITGRPVDQATPGQPAATGGNPTDPSSVAGINDFNTLMRGQGRNVGVMGDENSFVAKATANAPSLLGGKEEYVRTVYRQATALNVNPLAILVHWGTETGFVTNPSDKAFSCPVKKSTSFDRQASCSAETFDNWMKVFEEKNTDGKYFDPRYPNCVYDDPFIFAAEMYGPLCREYDGNENYLPNFVKFYKQILGAK